MKLYYIPTTRAVRPRWLLEEMAIPYEMVRVTMAMTKEPEYKQLHPHGKVPVLVDGEATIFESAAICAYLADKYLDKGFAPAPDSPHRAYYYQWLFYATATLEAPVEHFMFNILPNLPEKLLPGFIRSETSKQESYQWFQRVSEPVKEALHGKHFLVGNSLTAADVVVGGILLWAKKLGMMQPDDSLTEYIDNLMQRPAFNRADENYYAQVPVHSE
ncbi:glutathione S-transferase family protein [Anabaena sp. UHCC 0451]|uniref:glutathione S-transferase family protein n=1 Tax=Anabaena sp. UHCC 0451 TaxID=2055235 RepID=UPI002B21DBCB|nr:glutathione S-transferase family protein [Anabaena sp. UHCC 0451]MEA5578674.1 glutathione S-transferase family protein [Anabaena sp. UHCC 0451]